MVDYSKWNNLDSGDSDSDSDSEKTRQEQQVQKQTQQQQQQQKGQQGGDEALKTATDRRFLDQAESIRLQGNSAYERGDISTAMGAYEAQLRLLDGHKDDEAMEMTRGALLNQASALIRLEKFGEAEARCTKLLASAEATRSGAIGKGGGTSRARAFHFRGFARLRQEKHREACSDFKSALLTGVPNSAEAKALLAEAEAGAAMSSCPDPEAEGRELLRKGEHREAAKNFRDAASRARRRNSDRASDASGGTFNRVALARNLRMEGVAVAAAGDRSSAEMLLRGGLRELYGEGGDRAGMRGQGRAVQEKEEEGLMLVTLGRLLAQEGKHGEAVQTFRAAVTLLDGAMASTCKEKGVDEHSNGSQDATKIHPQPPSPPTTPGTSPQRRTLATALASLGTSLLALDGQQGTGGDISSSTAAPNPVGVTAGEGSPDTAAKCSRSTEGAAGGAAVATERDENAVAAPKEEDGDAIRALRRALDILKVEAKVATTSGKGGSADSDGGEAKEGVKGGDGEGKNGRDEDGMRAQMARVLDALSEAYARGRRWESARSAAEQSLTAWRSIGDSGRAGAMASLLSLGHLLLQLHGVDAGIKEASARWEEAAACFDECARPSDAAEVRLKVAGFYTKVARSDPARLEALEEKIASHFSKAADLFARQGEEESRSLQRAAAAVVASEASSTTGGVDNTKNNEKNLPLPLPPTTAKNWLETDGPSRWELAQKEALAWEGYAGAVGDDHDKAAKALRKAEQLLNTASVSDKGEAWTLRKVGLLQSLALASARGGDHATAEGKLMEAIESLEGLDGVSVEAPGGAHQGVLKDIFKYLAIARRTRGDMLGAKEALARVETLGGEGGKEEVEGLNRLLAHNRISVD